MRTSTASAVFRCSPAMFWATFLDGSYLRALHLNELECPAFSVLEAGDTSRKLRIVPKIGLPAPLAGLVGESFAYEDHGTLDRDRGIWTWRMVQPANLDASSKPRDGVLEMHGTICIEAMDQQRCRRRDDFTIAANLFGFGSLIESSVEQELLNARRKEYAFFTRWIDPQTPGTPREPRST